MANQFQKIPAGKKTVILDNGIAELICYATYEYKQKILSEEQFYTYKRLYQKFLELTPEMDLYIYCHCSIDTQIKRIQKRGRECERYIDREFLNGLQKEYTNWVNILPTEKLIIIDTECKVNMEELIEAIKSKCEGIL